MGFIAPFLPAIGGLLGSAFGKSGRQGGQQQQQQTTGTSQSTTTGGRTDTGRNVLEQFEDPSLSPFRQGVMGAFNEELDFARRPVFGDAERSQFLNQVNQQTEQAMGNISQRLAATGGLRSGSASDAATTAELGRGSNIAQFEAQLPFAERQARISATQPLLQLGLGFAGRGPMNQVQTSDNTQTFDINETGQTQQDTTGRTDVEGPGFLKSLAGAGGSLLGGLLSGNFNLDDLRFGNRPEQGPGNTSMLGASNDVGGVPQLSGQSDISNDPVMEILRRMGGQPTFGR